MHSTSPIARFPYGGYNEAVVKFHVPMPGLFGRRKRTHLGIDIGNASIKVVEAAPGKNGPELRNYAALYTPGYLRQLRETSQSVAMSIPENVLAERVSQVLDAAGIEVRQASMSIPLFSSFFTTLELPPMSRGELQQAITYEARQLVPIPVAEVILDWEVIGRVGKMEADAKSPTEKLLVLLVAVPREIVDRYVRIAKLAGIELDALEVEAFSLARSVVRDDKRILLVADIGARATSLLLFEDGTIRMSHSLETAGSTLTLAEASAFRIDLARAEASKVEQGMREDTPFEVRQMLATVLGGIAGEIEHMVETYRRSYGKQVEALYLSGGSGHLFGIDRFFAERLPFSVQKAQPFRVFSYPQELTPALEDLGGSLSVATGLALRNFAPGANR